MTVSSGLERLVDTVAQAFAVDVPQSGANRNVIAALKCNANNERGGPNVLLETWMQSDV